MASGEIEDVLSSIRRLVTEETKAATRPAGPPAEADKLILTPALRVVVEEAGPLEPAPPASGETWTDADGAAADWATADADTADRAAGPDAADSPPEAGAAAADPGFLAETAPAAEVVAPLPAEGDEAAALVASIGAATDLDAAAWESETGDAWSADLQEASVSVFSRHAAEDRPAAEGAPSGPDVPSEPAADSGSPATMAPDVPPGEAHFRRRADRRSGGRRRGDAATQVAAAPSPAAADSADPFAAAPEPVAAASDPVWADARPDLSFPHQAARAAHGVASVAAVLPLLSDDGDPFDEETLRDLVRELIREELQGSLGERITRNVRKLVRAEVQRALVAKSLE